MSKFASLAAVGVVGTGASVSGAYMLGAFDSPTTLFKDKSAFMASNGGECVQSLFEGISTMKDGTETSDSNKVDTTYFSDVSTKSKSGCLIVNWNKEIYEEGNGKGHLEFIGTHLTSDDKGFIVFTQLSSPTSGNNLDVSGIAYTIDKKSGSWALDKKHDISNPKSLTNDDFENKFPKAGDSFKKDKKLGDYWNFTSGKDDLSKICTTDKCKDEPSQIKYLQGKGTWSKESSAGSQSTQSKLTDGTSNLESGGNDFYSNTNGDMKTLFDPAQGFGTRERLIDHSN